MRDSLRHHIEAAGAWLAQAEDPDLEPLARLGRLECALAELRGARVEARFEAMRSEGVATGRER